MLDLPTGFANPFTFWDNFAITPVWSPDGTSVLYVASPSKLGAGVAESLYLKKADGG